MNLLEVYEEKKFPRTLFDEVQYEIYLLMLTDSFPRFLKTDLSLDTEVITFFSFFSFFLNL